jgi:hypothetical protein
LQVDRRKGRSLAHLDDRSDVRALNWSLDRFAFRWG